MKTFEKLVFEAYMRMYGGDVGTIVSRLVENVSVLEYADKIYDKEPSKPNRNSVIKAVGTVYADLLHLAGILGVNFDTLTEKMLLEMSNKGIFGVKDGLKIGDKVKRVYETKTGIVKMRIATFIRYSYEGKCVIMYDGTSSMKYVPEQELLKLYK